MEYSPKGIDIALKFADEARNLDSIELDWVHIWLKAKGRARRFYDNSELPGNDEIKAAEMLCTANTNPQFLIHASKIYLELCRFYQIKSYRTESKKMYQVSLDLITLVNYLNLYILK